MKLVIILALAAVAFAAPAHKQEKKEKKPVPQIIVYKFEKELDGSYILRVEQDDGIIREEQGILRIIKGADGKDHPVIVVKGKSQYPNEDGSIDVRTYGADEEGSKVEGDAIPKAPNGAPEEDTVVRKAGPAPAREQPEGEVEFEED